MFEICRNYMSIIITIVSNINRLVSYNIISLDFLCLWAMVLWLPQILYPTSTLLTRFSPGLPVLLQEIFYQPSFALISLLAKDNAFSKKTTFSLLAHGWSVLVLLFCLYVFFRFFFGVLPSWNCEYKAAVVFSDSEETKFELDTTSIILSYQYHSGNVKKELFRYC